MHWNSESTENKNRWRVIVWRLPSSGLTARFDQVTILSRRQRAMDRTRNKSAIILTASVAFLFAFALSSFAQEEVVTTTTGGGTSSTSTEPSFTGPAAGTTMSATAPATSTATQAPSGPTGTGVFTPTPVKIYATLSGGYDDNVNTTHTNQQGSEFASGNVILDYTFGDPRLQLALNAGAGGTYYFQHVSTQDYDIDLKGALGITYKVSPRFLIGSTLLIEYTTEPNFDNPGSLNSRAGNYLYTLDRLFASYLFSQRFWTKASFTFEAYDYDNQAVAATSNRINNLLGDEFHFQLAPTTSLVAEYRYGVVSYEDHSLDSNSHYALGGMDHVFNPRLTGSFRAGAQFKFYDNGEDRTAPYFEGSLIYALGRRTTVSWNTHYGLEEPDLPGEQSRTTFRSGVQTKFAWTSRVSSTLDLYFVHDDYHPLTSGLIATPGFSENSFDANLSLRYAITPLIGLQVAYHFTDVTSDVVFREYSRNRVSGGLTQTF